MPNKVSPENLLFILAYAFDTRWDYLEKIVGRQQIKDLSFFELLVFVLCRWVEDLIRHGLYKSFVLKEEEIKRLRGRLIFGSMIRKGEHLSDSLFCSFDDLSFDTKENQIILSVLHLCVNQLGQKVLGLTEERKKTRNSLLISSWKLERILSSQITYFPITWRSFEQIQYHRTNKNYKPIIAICRFIYDSVALGNLGDKRFIDVPEEKMSQLFEQFLRNYLAEALINLNFKVESGMVIDWVKPIPTEQILHFPGIHPDIVIWKNNKPIFLIDAKFYNDAVYKVEAGYSDKIDDNKPVVYKTHSHNLYQLISYINYFNCDGLLVYAQSESGHFDEQAFIDPKYYPQNFPLSKNFGFYTLDLTGNLESFKVKMAEFTQKIVSNISKIIN